METYKFKISPVAKPRMTQKDKWAKRPIVSRYFVYKDLLKLEANKMGLENVPGRLESLIFYVQMPRTWSYKKKIAMNGRGHEQTPDIDNLLKGFMDALCKEDKHIYAISNGLAKFWAIEGSIHLTI